MREEYQRYDSLSSPLADLNRPTTENEERDEQHRMGSHEHTAPNPSMLLMVFVVSPVLARCCSAEAAPPAFYAALVDHAYRGSYTLC